MRNLPLARRPFARSSVHPRGPSAPSASRPWAPGPRSPIPGFRRPRYPYQRRFVPSQAATSHRPPRSSASASVIHWRRRTPTGCSAERPSLLDEPARCLVLTSAPRIRGLPLAVCPPLPHQRPLSHQPPPPHQRPLQARHLPSRRPLRPLPPACLCMLTRRPTPLLPRRGPPFLSPGSSSVLGQIRPMHPWSPWCPSGQSSPYRSSVPRAETTWQSTRYQPLCMKLQGFSATPPRRSEVKEPTEAMSRRCRPRLQPRGALASLG